MLNSIIVLLLLTCSAQDSEEVKKLKDEIASLKRAVTQTRDSYEARAAKLDRQIRRMVSERDELNKEITALAEGLSKAEKARKDEVDVVQERLEKVSDRLETARDELYTMETKFNKSQFDLNKTRGKMDAMFLQLPVHRQWAYAALENDDRGTLDSVRITLDETRKPLADLLASLSQTLGDKIIWSSEVRDVAGRLKKEVTIKAEEWICRRILRDIVGSDLGFHSPTRGVIEITTRGKLAELAKKRRESGQYMGWELANYVLAPRVQPEELEAVVRGCLKGFATPDPVRHHEAGTSLIKLGRSGWDAIRRLEANNKELGAPAARARKVLQALHANLTVTHSERDAVFLLVIDPWKAEDRVRQLFKEVRRFPGESMGKGEIFRNAFYKWWAGNRDHVRWNEKQGCYED